ncbi:zinc finger protein 414 [Pitangus sulphuratus]|nr:zinc finger protein 414 [Pitangus sulphuratus]
MGRQCSITRRSLRGHIPHPVPCTGQAMKTEKDEAVPTFSLRGKYGGEGAGCSEVALPGAPMPVAGGTPTQDLRPLKRRPVPGKHYQCSSYGCKLAFPSMQELMDHLKVHYRPTQSLEGKTFHCPTLGCTETFPSMQDLMAHMKVHYKPNRYFKADKPVLPPATSALDKEPPAKPPPEGLPKLPSALPRPLEKEALLPGVDSAAAPAALPTSLPELPGSLEALPLVPPAPHPFPLLEPGLFGPSSLTRFSGPPPSSVPGPFLSYVPPSPYALPQPPAQHRHSSNSRIVWEHTRGRYSCTQCPFSAASREEMTLHIEDHRKNPPSGRLDAEMDFGVGLASFHAKLTPEMENSLYSQL